MALRLAPNRDVLNLQNWVDGTGALARDETEYLSCRNDLASLVPPADCATAELESLVEDSLIRFHKDIRQVRR